MREEKARGKRHVDTAAEDEIRQLRRTILRLAKEIDHEEDFVKAISGLSLPGDKIAMAVAAWREMKRSRR
jgi:hypothetical protein